jgi:hypothetical protein
MIWVVVGKQKLMGEKGFRKSKQESAGKDTVTVIAENS